MKSIRLVVSDIDSTLYTKESPIPDEFPVLIKKCQNRGILFGLATGRTQELAARFLQQLHPTAPCILANGAFILDAERVLRTHGFHVGKLRPILERACRDGLTVTVSDTQEEYPLFFTPYILEQQQLKNRFWNRIDLDSETLIQKEFVKLMIFDPDRTGKIKPYQAELQQYHDHYWVTSFSDRAVELGPKNCNKATGLKELAKILGIGMNQVMAIGDFSNDLEMIQAAGIGVAVANASDDVKAAADYVTQEPLAIGVMEALHKFCLKE